MNKKTLLLTLIILMSITACDKAGEVIEKRNSPVEGSEGVVFEFYRNTPPKQVLEGQSFPLAFKIQNKGACDLVQKGRELSEDRCTLIEPAYFALVWDKQNIDIEWEDKIKELVAETPSGIPGDIKRLTINPNKKEGFDERFAAGVFLIGRAPVPGPAGSRSITEGEERLIILESKAKEFEEKSRTKDSLTGRIRASLCYPYETRLSTDICIDSDLFNLDEKEKTCQVVLDQDLRTQGAPVAITQMKTDMLPTSDGIVPRFEFTIKNVGKGKVIKSGLRDAACAGFLLERQSEENRIKFTAQLPGQGKQLYCGKPKEKKTSTEIQLNQETEQETVICETDEFDKSEGSFITPLQVTLAYDYFDTQAEEVKIEQVRRKS